MNIKSHLPNSICVCVCVRIHIHTHTILEIISFSVYIKTSDQSPKTLISILD